MVRVARRASTKQLRLREAAEVIERCVREIRTTVSRPDNAEYSRDELTSAETIVMQALFPTNGIGMMHLCQQVGLTHGSVSVLLEGLIKRGMVTRKTAKRDRRVTIIAVTPSVREFVAKEAPRFAAVPFKKVLGSAKPVERVRIIRGLQTLHALLIGNTSDASGSPAA